MTVHLTNRLTGRRTRVLGRIDGTQGGTIIINQERQLVAVRPKGRRREYILPLALVCEFVVTRVVKQELGK